MTPLHHLWKLFLILPDILSSGSKTTDERLILEWGLQSVLTASTSVSLFRLRALVEAQVYADVALQDYTKYAVLVCLFSWAIVERCISRRWKARTNPPSSTEVEDTLSPHVPPGPKKDYSLKEGQTFSISIPGRGGKSDDGLNVLGSGRTSSVSHLMEPASGSGGAIPLLPPPPSVSKRC